MLCFIYHKKGTSAFHVLPGENRQLHSISRHCVYCDRRSQESKSKIYSECHSRPSQASAINKLPWICFGTNCISKTDIKLHISFKFTELMACKIVCYKHRLKITLQASSQLCRHSTLCRCPLLLYCRQCPAQQMWRPGRSLRWGLTEYSFLPKWHPD